MSSLSLRDVHKSYPGGAPAVRGIDLDIANGEFVTIVGPSGCGKSTLLNLIAGLDSPTSGTIRIDDDVVTDWPPRARDVAMVFQSYALYPHMNVRRNIGFALEVSGVPSREREQRVRETAARLEIESLLDRKPGELSGGQRQRVALGRALVRRPRVFLFDEPLSNLDVTLRMQMRAELKKLHEELRGTFVYVTHDQSEAMTLSDRVVVLNEGRVQQVAPPREVHARPANMFVAGFFGAPRINFVEPATLGFAMAAARDALIGLRPADVRVTAAPLEKAHESAREGRVYLVEPMGSETWVTVQVGAERITGRASEDFAAASGAPAWIEIDASRVLWFERASGTRIEPIGAAGATSGLQPERSPA